jgi:fucose 4-O-acetylase-like acetyltransferase
MPLFMFVSGFVCYRANTQTNLIKGIKRRFVQLLLPFFIWSFVVSPLIKWNFDTTKFINLFLYPDSGLWFLWVLFFIHVIFLILSNLAGCLKINKSLILAGGAAVLYILYLASNFRFFGFQFISWYFMFFTIGYLYHKYVILITKYIKWLFVISAILFPVLAYHWQIKTPPIIFDFTIHNNLWLYMYKFISVIFAIPFFMYLFQLYDKKFRILDYIGKDTLGIYVMHGIISSLAIKPVYESIAYNMNFYLFTCLTVIILISVCCLINFLIRKVPVFRLLFLGEKKDKHQ